MSQYTDNEKMWQWADRHAEQLMDRLRSKSKDASEVEQVSYDSERMPGLLAVFSWQGVRKVISVTPSSLLEEISHLDEAVRLRCETAAAAAEEQAVYAEGQGDYAAQQAAIAEALITTLRELGATVELQGDIAEAQGAQAEALMNEVSAWYTPFREQSESWYSGIVSTVSNWLSGVQTTVQGIVDDVTEWFQYWQARVSAFFGNMSDTWDDMTFMFSDTQWNSQTVYLRNKATSDEQGNWWVSLKSTVEEPNVNHPLPGFDSNGQPVASEWWKLWIDWQHPMARVLNAIAAAQAQTEAAEAAAQRATDAAEAAEEVDVVDHENRITTLEELLLELTTEDIVEIRQAIESLNALIGTDLDGTINKFNELVAFMAGMGESDTLQGKLQEIAALLAQKQPAGDYATNARVDEVEAKIGRYCSPRFEGTQLVFPAESTAHFEGTSLILTQ